MKNKRTSFAAIPFLALGLAFALAIWAVPASAQTAQVPDMTQFGFPTVGGTVTFTPGTAATVSAGNQKVDLPADFISKTVTFDLLIGDPSTFAPLLTGEDAGKPVLTAFAFRVTDPATGKLIGRFDKPVVYSVTDGSVTSESEVYNTSATNPAKVTDNPTAATIQGTTLSHSFGGAGVGWIVANTIAQTSVPTGMPQTGAGERSTWLVALFGAALVLLGGLTLRLQARRRAS